ncbi:hypothetical protein TNCV_899411 [Trichonephila clavipes]|nr:hypothetical protein TNCV_899411 [Trichonephila clavipes]
MIPHDVSRLHSGFLTKLRQTCTLPVPCCSVMKQPFHVKEVLPELLTDVPETIRRRMWFQQNGAPSHYARHVREHLDRTFPNRWKTIA